MMAPSAVHRALDAVTLPRFLLYRLHQARGHRSQTVGLRLKTPGGALYPQPDNPIIQESTRR